MWALISLALSAVAYSLYAAAMFHKFGDVLPETADDDVIGYKCRKFWQFFGLFRL